MQRATKRPEPAMPRKEKLDPAVALVRELCSFKRRRAGTDAERRAANRIAERLREAGRKAEVEPTYVHPQWGLVHALHCLLGFAGSLIAVPSPPVGFALVLLAATSMYLDLNGRLYLLRLIFFRRASQNVYSPGRSAKARAGRLVLCANLDAAKTGYVFDPRRTRRAQRIGDRLHLPAGLFRPLFWSLAILLPAVGARLAGVDSELISLVQLPPTLILMVGAFALVDVELSEVTPGANSNASGAAAALGVAARLDEQPLKHLTVDVLLTGAAEPQQEGLRSFLRSRRKRLDRENTIFICLDSVGAGQVRYEASGGWVVSYGADPRLLELCGAVAEAERDGRFDAKPVKSGEATEATMARIAGYRGTAITCLDDDGLARHHRRPEDRPEGVDPDAIESATAFAVQLARALDRDAGRRNSAG